jgi:tetratricopeptide (TPR) repeat protein
MSHRTRVRVVVAAAAAAAAALVVGVTVLQAEDEQDSPEPRDAASEAPPLELGLLLRDDREARALRAAERLLEEGRRAAARARFAELLRANPESVEAAVGVAVAAWPTKTTERLRALVVRRPDSGVARLHLGFALLAEGEAEAAEREWRKVEQRDPDSPAALRAEDVLHPEMAPGRPPFVADLPRPEGLESLRAERQLEELRRRAEAGGAEDWLLYGIGLQRIGQPVSAMEAFLRAAEIEPDQPIVQVAAAVGRFDKDAPAETFSRLGPLAAAHPREAVVRYHLGLCLTWIGAVQEAKRQLGLAREAGEGGFYAREAERLFERLEDVGT